MTRFLPLLLLLVSCSSRPFLSRDAFYDVPVGTSISSVMEDYGRPDELKASGDPAEYIYTERRELAPELMEHIQYVFLVKNGYVVGKDVRRDEAYPNHSID